MIRRTLGGFLIALSVLLFMVVLTHRAHADETQETTGAVNTRNYQVGVTDGTANVVNHAIDKGTAALAQISSRLEKNAPAAYNMVVRGIRAQAESALIVGGMSLLWSVLSWSLCFYNMHVCKNYQDCVHISESIIFGVMGTVASLSTLYHLGSSDSWAAMLSPDGILALQILHSVVH